MVAQFPPKPGRRIWYSVSFNMRCFYDSCSSPSTTPLWLTGETRTAHIGSSLSKLVYWFFFEGYVSNDPRQSISYRSIRESFSLPLLEYSKLQNYCLPPGSLYTEVERKVSTNNANR